jgi:hypothetical protein
MRPVIACLAMAGAGSCPIGQPSAPEPTAEELRLRRQVDQLRRLVADAEQGRLFGFEQMLVVVHQRLVQELLTGVVPLAGDVGGDFHVRLVSARASFTDGLALVELSGDVRMVDRPAWAAMTLHGGLEAFALDRSSGQLRASVSVYAADIEHAEVLGIGEPARRLMEALAEGGLERLLGPVLIPVRVADRVALPAVRAKRVRIAARELPVVAEMSSLRVFDGRLWVGLSSRLPEPEAAPRAEGPAPAGEDGAGAGT